MISTKSLTVLFNDDHVHSGGLAEDALAVAAVHAAAEGVAAAAAACGWRPRLLGLPAEPAAILPVMERVRQQGDLVFNLVESVGGRAALEPAVAYLLELAGLTYTGSPARALLLAQQKPLARAVLAAAGVAVPAGAVLESGEEPLAGRPPWIVKPSAEDASHGISCDSVVHDEAAARARARLVIERYGQPALVEEFVEGREINVSIIGEGSGARLLPPGEIDFSKFPGGRPKLVTYRAKWDESSSEFAGTVTVVAAPLSDELGRQVELVALGAYRALGLRDYGRVDIRLGATGPVVLDVNPNPDISRGAGLALAAARAGLAYEALIAGIIEAAAQREVAAASLGGGAAALQ